MSNAIKKLHDYLAKSPSVVYPQDVLAYLPAIEAENAKLRELLIDVSEEVPWSFMDTTKYCMPLRADKLRKLLCRMRELGVEVDA